MYGYLLAAGAGAALAYFFDPQQGRRRRNMTRDRLGAIVRRGGRRMEAYGEYAGGKAQGAAHEVAHAVADVAGAGAAEAPTDDATLAHKVESILFRDPDVPKGKINVNVERGVVVLRGEAARPEQIRALGEQARAIPGVRDVENLLHLPDTPARMS